MKKLFTLLLMTIFSLTIFANPVFAGRGYGNGGHGGGYSGHSSRHYSGHNQGGHHYSGHGGHRYYGHGGNGHINGWEAAAIGLGVAVVGSAIINSYPREREVVVEHRTYYSPAPPPPPQYREYCYECPTSYDPPPRVWVPGHSEPVGGGYYRRVPGHWE